MPLQFILFFILRLNTLNFILFSVYPENHNVKVSVNDIVIKAVAVALRNVPHANGNKLLTLEVPKFGMT